jgi:hypothetical protein
MCRFCAGFVPVMCRFSNFHGSVINTLSKKYTGKVPVTCRLQCAGFVPVMPAQKRHILNRLVSFYSTEI